MDIRHGYDCVCSDTCRNRHARYQRDRRRDQYLGRPRMVPALGTHRRLQALRAAGWSWTHLAARYGNAPTNMPKMLQRPMILADTAHAVAVLYAQLVDETPPPFRRQAYETRQAAAAGWQPPEAWLDHQLDDPAAVPYDGTGGPDEVLLARILAGDLPASELPAMHWSDRLPFVDRWEAAGWSLAALERAGWNPHRDRRMYSNRAA